jgi:hypothetical protein
VRSTEPVGEMPPALLFLKRTSYLGKNKVGGGGSWVLNYIDPSVPLYLHIQAVCEAALARKGIGVLE